MPVEMTDPTDEVRNRIREIQSADDGAGIGMDDRELAEREEAARAYAGENEQHFVDYLEDCVKTSVDAKREVRRTQEECWRVFNEIEPDFYSKKEDWQSRVVVPKPFGSVMYGAAAARKAFTPNFLSIESSGAAQAANRFWAVVLNSALSKTYADFTTRFVDALIMALAVGESLEMIPQFSSGNMLSFDLVEPWKIQRDPDAPNRDPQGGMYWIHQEWLDFFLLKEGEKAGRYFEVGRARDVSHEPDNPLMTREAIARRKEHIWNRSNFRTMILTSEFWGVVLAPNGEMLLPRATYTVAGGRVIQKPGASPYEFLRWPGVGFSPLPSVLKFGGRGLIQGVTRVWESMCNIMCLHEDYFKWIVNPSKEINVDGLVDPTDTEDMPGKEFLTRDTAHGQQVVRVSDRRDTTASVIGNMNYYDLVFQKGSMVTDAVQGFGQRSDITAREAAQNLDQSLSVFALMGHNMEAGAIEAVYAAYDTLRSFAKIEDLQTLLNESNEKVDGELLEIIGSREVPELTGRLSVSGMEALFKDNDTLRYIMQYMLPLANHPKFEAYIDSEGLVRAVERRANLRDEKIVLSSEKVMEAQKQRAAEAAAVEAAAAGGDDPRSGSEPASPSQFTGAGADPAGLGGAV